MIFDDYSSARRLPSFRLTEIPQWLVTCGTFHVADTAPTNVNTQAAAKGRRRSKKTRLGQKVSVFLLENTADVSGGRDRDCCAVRPLVPSFPLSPACSIVRVSVLTKDEGSVKMHHFEFSGRFPKLQCRSNSVNVNSSVNMLQFEGRDWLFLKAEEAYCS